MSDVIRISTLMRLRIDDFKRAVLCYCQEHWEEDSFYPAMWEEVSNMSDQELILKALNDQFCYYKYKEKVKDLCVQPIIH